LILQGMNGTLSADDRKAVAAQIGLIRKQMIELGNFRIDGRYLYAGTKTSTEPFSDVEIDGHAKVLYHGSDEGARLRIGVENEVQSTIPGSEIFGKQEPQGLSIGPTTGLAKGASASQGSGIETLVLRHDATDGGAIAGVGVALVDGGAG